MVDPGEPVLVLCLGRSDDDLAASLAPAERAVLAGLTFEKRRREWLAGRVAAKAAVQALVAAEGRAVPAADAVVVLSSPAGAPRVIAPDDAPRVALSVSHGHGRGAAWALRSGPGGGLPGVDLELIRPRRPGTFRFYLAPEERTWVLGQGGPEGDPATDAAPGPRDAAAVLAWAIKEAAFKALQPPRGTGLLDVRLATDDPALAAGLAPGGAGTAQVAYTGALLAHGRALGLADGAVRCRWRRDGDLVLAWVVALGCVLPD